MISVWQENGVSEATTAMVIERAEEQRYTQSKPGVSSNEISGYWLNGVIFNLWSKLLWMLPLRPESFLPFFYNSHLSIPFEVSRQLFTGQGVCQSMGMWAASEPQGRDQRPEQLGNESGPISQKGLLDSPTLSLSYTLSLPLTVCSLKA